MSLKVRSILGTTGTLALVLSLLGTPYLLSDAAWADAVHTEAAVQAGKWTDPEPPGPPGPVEPILPGNDDTRIEVKWSVNSPVDYCAYVQITTDSKIDIEWSVGIHINENPMHGVVPTRIQPAQPGKPDQNGLMFVVGTSNGSRDYEAWNNNYRISASTPPLTIELCNNNNTAFPPIVKAGKDTYGYTVAFRGDDWYGCAVAEVTGYSSPFFVGYEVFINWEQTLDEALADGQITPEGYQRLHGRGLNQFSGNGTIKGEALGDDIWRLTPQSASISGVRLGNPQTMQGCSSG